MGDSVRSNRPEVSTLGKKIEGIPPNSQENASTGHAVEEVDMGISPNGELCKNDRPNLRDKSDAPSLSFFGKDSSKKLSDQTPNTTNQSGAQ